MTDAPIRIQRLEHERDFTIIGNATIQDPSLSFKATGLLCYLLSLPHDWRVNLADLSNRKTEGISAVRSGFDELQTAGYVHREQIRNDQGQIVEWLVTVSEQPIEPEAETTSRFSTSSSTTSSSPTSRKPDATKDPPPTKDPKKKVPTPIRGPMYAETCNPSTAIEHWPRDEEVRPHYVKGPWRLGVRNAGGTSNMAMAYNAWVHAWADRTDLHHCMGIQRWLKEERYRDGLSPVLPPDSFNPETPATPPPDDGPPHPADVLPYDAQGRDLTAEEHERAREDARVKWEEHHGRPAWPT